MAPKHEQGGETLPDPTINWIEFRDTLLASQTVMQASQTVMQASQTVMQASIRELSQALVRHLNAANPPAAAAVVAPPQHTAI